ncbi:hypothetical protein M426DRAFT_317232 [Hypoxylon sp. CI-4A]|nr:hypothetical protein M426DRAFT_317232 [Hypoxylon sp. CI-4A]
MSSAPKPAAKPHSAPTDHNQAVPDPLAHFNAIPWCARLLADPNIIEIVIPDRRALPSGESNFVRRTMNSATAVRACVTFFRTVDPAAPRPARNPSESAGASTFAVYAPSGGGGVEGKGVRKEEETIISKSKELLSGGGEKNGEDPRNPFLLFSALADLGVDCQSYPGIMHGGLYSVLMDEVMGTAANFQSEHGAFTVRFTTNYRRAVRTPQVVVIRGRVVRKDGRKIYVKGTIEDKDGNILAEADGMWLAMGRNIGRSQL